MSANRFLSPMGAEPVHIAPRHPTAAQIAAVGRALPIGRQDLTPDQQRAWFGGVVFHEPVQWDGEAFTSGDLRLTSHQVAARARGL